MAGAAEIKGGANASLTTPNGAAPGFWLRLPSPLLAVGLALSGVLVDSLIGWRLPSARLGPVPLGALVACAGMLWLVWARRVHRRAGNPIRPLDAPRVLVDEGPFRFGRHPMYLGIVLLLMGLALLAAAPGLWLAAAFFFAVVDRVHVPHEEAALRRAFGGWYSDYAASVRRWI